MAFSEISPKARKDDDRARVTREFAKQDKPLPVRRKVEVADDYDAAARSQQLWDYLQENRTALEERVEPLVHLRHVRAVPSSYNGDHLSFYLMNRDAAQTTLQEQLDTATSAKEKVRINTALQLLAQQKELMQQFLASRLKERSDAAKGTTVLKTSDLLNIPETETPPVMPAVARKAENGPSFEALELQEAEELWTRLSRLRDELARIDIDDVDMLEFKGALPAQFTPSIMGLNCVNFNEVYEKLEGNKKYSYETGVMRRYKVLYDRFYQLAGKMKRGRPLTEAQPIPVIGVGRSEPMERTESMQDSGRKMNVAASIRNERARAEARKKAETANRVKDLNDAFDFMKTPRRSPETAREKAELLWSELILAKEELQNTIKKGGLPAVKFKGEGLSRISPHTLDNTDNDLQFTGQTDGLEIDLPHTEKILATMYKDEQEASTNKIQKYLRNFRDYKKLVEQYQKELNVEVPKPPQKPRKAPPIARNFEPIVPEMEEKMPGKFDTKINPEQPKRIWEELVSLRSSLEQVRLGFGKTITFYGEVPDQYDGGNEGLAMMNPEKVLETLKNKGMKNELSDAKNYFLLMEEYSKIAGAEPKNSKELKWWKAGRGGEYSADESPVLKVLEMSACSGLSDRQKQLIMENDTFRDAFRRKSADVSFDMLSETKAVNIKLSQLVLSAAKEAVHKLGDSLRKDGFKVDGRGEPSLLTRWFQKGMVNSDRYREYKALFDLHTAMDRDHVNNFNATFKNAKGVR